ncbi:hypothetical protein GCM10007877_21390 [Marinibactrum halimedae]|uniref:Uncharacterized protein n=1 Tax=Marinibactrum halimedae TaxID=1444977 RepID=A0AA37T3V1_9GAMM|nr:hypothetical protein GCM10007877_21390 [Marinibactrum halimedae]
MFFDHFFDVVIVNVVIVNVVIVNVVIVNVVIVNVVIVNITPATKNEEKGRKKIIKKEC